MLKEFRPCPFCGGKELLVSEREFFDEQVEKSGSFCVSVSCKKCDVEMYAHKETDYDLAIWYLQRKWNRRETSCETD